MNAFTLHTYDFMNVNDISVNESLLVASKKHMIWMKCRFGMSDTVTFIYGASQISVWLVWCDADVAYDCCATEYLIFLLETSYS